MSSAGVRPLGQQYYRCTVPAAEELRGGTAGEQPPSALLIQPPYDMDTGHDMTGHAVIRIRFDHATCRGCLVRAACTWAQRAPDS